MTRPPDDGARDAAFMRRAIELAGRGRGQVAPNPLVGAVVVRDGVVVGEGWHRRFGGPHAEVEALRAAGERARGATVYVSLEPCNHVGKTPPCTEALLAAGVARVVAAIPDPSPRAGGGLARLATAGIATALGVEADAARELVAPFLFALHADRPWVTLKLALSIDGALTDATRGRGWLTGGAARAEVHRLRAASDAVAVGIGTALLDDPSLTVRDAEPPRVPPVRVVFDREARLPLESALVRTARETPVACVVAPDAPIDRVARLRDAGVAILEAPTMAEGLRALRAREVRSLLVEGGAGIASALVSETLVDRLIIFRAPVVLGAGAVNAFGGVPGRSLAEARRLRVVERGAFGDDEMTTYALTEP